MNNPNEELQHRVLMELRLSSEWWNAVTLWEKLSEHQVQVLQVITWLSGISFWDIIWWEDSEFIVRIFETAHWKAITVLDNPQRIKIEEDVY